MELLLGPERNSGLARFLQSIANSEPEPDFSKFAVDCKSSDPRTGARRELSRNPPRPRASPNAPDRNNRIAGGRPELPCRLSDSCGAEPLSRRPFWSHHRIETLPIEIGDHPRVLFCRLKEKPDDAARAVRFINHGARTESLARLSKERAPPRGVIVRDSP
jgi:hypothetical protein